MTATRRALACAAFVALAIAASGDARAHIGSPNVYFTGEAGPYPVRVVIRPPAALPGRAEVNVTVEGEGVGQVRVLAAPAGVAPEMLPPPDVAPPVPGVAGLHAAELWLMEAGAYGVRVAVQGARGEGEAVVPLNAVNQPSPEMAPWLRASLIALSLTLAAGAVVIAAGTAREASLPPAEAPADVDRRRGRIAGGVMAAVLAAALALGFSAWRRMDADYRSNQLFRPMPIAAEAGVAGPRRVIRLRALFDERGRAEWPRLVTDHGKLMHVFLIREPELDAFAHVHPRPVGPEFAVAVPPLPAGTYRVYADVTQESGLSQTLTTTVAVPSPPPATAPDPDPSLAADPDDSWIVAKTPPGTSTTVPLDGGYRMVWRNPGVVAHPGEQRLEFEVQDPAGQPAHLTPYMGMIGHAAVRRDDGSVFAHLHPAGSISMASQTVFEAARTPSQDAGDGMAGMDHSKHMGIHDAAAMSRVAFPYVFPRRGSYRIWVQVKPGDTVMTGVFDATVTAADSD
jgi:hypothetical protein